MTTVTAPSEAEATEVEDKPPAKTTGRKKETLEPLLQGTWVVLGDTDKIPEEVQGHLAVITDSQVERVASSALSPRPHDHQDEDAEFSVKTRDEFSLEIPGLTRDDFAKASRNGRQGVLASG